MTEDPTGSRAAEAAWRDWCARRRAELAAPDGWPGLIGLFWLEPGRNAVGSAEDAVVRLPGGPARLGDIVLQDGRLTWHPAGASGIPINESGVGGEFLRLPGGPGIPASTAGPVDVSGPSTPLASDAAGAPTVLGLDHWRFFVIARDGRYAVRLRDLDWASRTPLPPLDYFPFAASWQVDASWDALAEPLTMEVPSVTGELKAVTVSHRASFRHAGQTVSLLPLSIDESGVFFVFRDRTSGPLTYGGGRFLKAGPPCDGRLRLDFNRAYNPPCAFSPFATCPLPPPENWLGFPVEAGERKLDGH